MTCSTQRDIIVVCNKGGGNIAGKSRADYFKKRREDKKQFSVLLDKQRAEALENRLLEINKTKVSWLNEKIGEERCV